MLHLKCERRTCERRLKNAKNHNLPNINDLQRQFSECTKKYFNRMKEIRENFSKKEISDAKNDSKALYKLCEKLTDSSNDISSDLSVDDLSKFFTEKIQDIRDNIPKVNTLDIPPKNVPIPFIEFFPTSEEEISKLIKSSKKTKSPCDVFPSSLYTSILPIILPHLNRIFNLSLSSGIFPTNFKHAAVFPILKKANLDPNIPSSFQPISLLPFLSKILEKIVANRIRNHSALCDADEVLQSGYKSMHSTETALLKVTNDLRRAADNNKISICLNLDLSAAFETLDHDELLKRLNKYLGISGNALLWFKSYLKERTQSVYFKNKNSKAVIIKYGVPQGSVLGYSFLYMYFH